MLLSVTLKPKIEAVLKPAFYVAGKKCLTEILHYNTFYIITFLRYEYFRYAKCLFKNRETKAYVKSCPLFKKNTNFTDK